MDIRRVDCEPRPGASNEVGAGRDLSRRNRLRREPQGWQIIGPRINTGKANFSSEKAWLSMLGMVIGPPGAAVALLTPAAAAL